MEEQKETKRKLTNNVSETAYLTVMENANWSAVLACTSPHMTTGHFTLEIAWTNARNILLLKESQTHPHPLLQYGWGIW